MSKVIDKIETPFGLYTVIEEMYNNRPSRMLLSPSGAPQSGIGLDELPEQLFMYNQRFMEIAVGMRPNRVLVVGGGVFTFPCALANQLGLLVDVVELNPALVDIANKYFYLSELGGSLNIHIEDGFEHIKNSNTDYGYIVVDAFMDRETPASLMSRPAAAEYKRLLSDDGVVAFNCISRYHTWSDTVLKDLVRSLGVHFNYIDVYPADLTMDKRGDQNLIVVASNVDNSNRHDYLQSYSVEVLGV